MIQFPNSIDVAMIREEIERNHWAWDFDKRRQESIYEQRDTKMIPLRHSPQRMGMKVRDTHEVYDTDIQKYFPATMHFVNWHVETFGGECGRIAIVKLPSDKSVVPHIDEGAYYRARERFHLVIQGMYDYNVNGESNIFTAGDLFWFNSQLRHYAKNIGSIDRIVVIFDVKGSRYREMLSK